MSAKVKEDYPLPVDKLEQLMEQNPFGNNDYITKQMHESYRRRLRKVSSRLPEAGKLLDAVDRSDTDGKYRIFGDTVLRCAVQHAHVRVEAGTEYGLPLEQCAEVFTETTRLLESGESAPLGSSLSERFGSQPYHGWVWDDACNENVFTRAFRVVVRENYGIEEPCTPDRDQLAVFRRGVRLLEELLPLLSRSALSHVHLASIFPPVGEWARRLSSSEFRVSGTIFLSTYLMNNPWAVAEHVFHEALHQQMYDIRAGHLLLNPDFVRPDAPEIHSPWNRPDASRGNYWDVHRALAAFHVYVHLALLSMVAEKRHDKIQEYGPIRMIGKRTALVRAHYLGEQLRERAWKEFGRAGERFVEWFGSVLELLDTSPPAPGACVHLLLDRYWREATEVDSLPQESETETIFTQRLQELANDEVGTARKVLTMIRDNVDEFDSAVAGFADQHPLKQFVSVRTLISDTILNVAPDNFQLAESKVPDELVRQMVERSSEVLRTLLHR